jgi:hypothetical protein
MLAQERGERIGVAGNCLTNRDFSVLGHGWVRETRLQST